MLRVYIIQPVVSIENLRGKRFFWPRWIVLGRGGLVAAPTSVIALSIRGTKQVGLTRYLSLLRHLPRPRYVQFPALDLPLRSITPLTDLWVMKDATVAVRNGVIHTVF
jgi:hypothetical protein